MKRFVKIFIVVVILLICSTANAQYINIANNFTRCDSEECSFNFRYDKPGMFLKMLLPPGTVRAELLIFKPQAPLMPAAVRVDCPPQCMYASYMSAEGYRKLPFPDVSQFTIDTLSKKDLQVRGTSGIVKVNVLMTTPLQTARWLFVKCLKFDSGAYVYQTSYNITVRKNLYNNWYDRGQPKPAVGCDKVGYCSKEWATSVSGGGTTPEPSEECNALMEAICGMQHMKCVNNTCVEEELPEITVDVNVGQEKMLNLTEPKVVIKKVKLHGVPNGNGKVIAAYADLNAKEVYIATKSIDGSIVFKKFCQGDPITPYSDVVAINNTISTNAFAHLGAIKIETVYAVFFMSALIEGKLYYATFQQGE